MPKVKIAGNYNSYLYFDHDGRRFAQKTGTFGKLEHAAAAQDSLQACFKEDAPIDDKELERQFVNGNMSTVLEYLEAAPPAEAARAAVPLRRMMSRLLAIAAVPTWDYPHGAKTSWYGSARLSASSARSS